MEQRSLLQPAFTAHPEWFNLSITRPVRVASWMPGSGPLRAIHPGMPDFPGWPYGDVVFTPEQQDRRPHDHEYYEVCIIRSGVALHYTNGVEEELRGITVIIMAPGAVHSIYGVRDLVQTNIYYLPEWLCDDLSTFWRQEGFVPLFLAAALFRTPLARNAFKFTLTEAEMASIDQELGDIGKETVLGQPSLVFLNSTLVKLLIKLSRACVRQYAREQCAEDMLLAFRPEVRKALELIEQRLLQSEPFAPADLPERMNLSPNHCTAVFKQAIGWAPMEYYQRRRVHHACRLLLSNPEKQITDIALELGYTDSAHMCHFFKRYQGLSPNQYRAHLWRNP